MNASDVTRQDDRPQGDATALPRKTCILVLGMHRSGTSALTRVISLLGAALPRNVMGPGPGNDAGHWEPERLVELHDRMLAEAGSSWDDWRDLDLKAQLPEARLASYRAEIAECLCEEYGQASFIVLKEPRVCRFVPLFREILEELGYAVRPVLIHRNPLSVSQSLLRRNKMPEAMTLPYWLRHGLDAEAQTRDLPRGVLDYDDLMVDWRAEVDRIGSAIGVRWPRDVDAAADEIDEFLSPEHRHHLSTETDIETSEAGHSWILEAYHALRLLEADPATAQRKLDELSAGFNTATTLFSRALAAERQFKQKNRIAVIPPHRIDQLDTRGGQAIAPFADGLPRAGAKQADYAILATERGRDRGASASLPDDHSFDQRWRPAGENAADPAVSRRPHHRSGPGQHGQHGIRLRHRRG